MELLHPYIISALVAQHPNGTNPVLPGDSIILPETADLSFHYAATISDYLREEFFPIELITEEQQIDHLHRWLYPDVIIFVGLY